MRIVIAAALAVGLLFPQAAQATAEGNVAARKASRAAERRFNKVTPDTWAHANAGCRSTDGWAYWHCRVKVVGHKGYRGDFNVLVNRATRKAYVRGFVITAP